MRTESVHPDDPDPSHLERAEAVPRVSLAEDPALNTSRVSGVVRNNIRFAEIALAAGEERFKIMPEPGKDSLAVRMIDPEAFLQAAARLRDEEQAFIKEHGPVEKDRGLARGREIMRGASHRPTAENLGRSRQFQAQLSLPDADLPDTSEFSLPEGVAVRPNGHRPGGRRERGRKILKRLSPVSH